MGRTDAMAYDPSGADYRATSPFEWGGSQDMSVPDDRAYRSRKPKRASIRQPWLSRQTGSSSAGLRGSRCLQVGQSLSPLAIVLVEASSRACPARTR